MIENFCDQLYQFFIDGEGVYSRFFEAVGLAQSSNLGLQLLDFAVLLFVHRQDHFDWPQWSSPENSQEDKSIARVSF